jgi:hypothetical protein
LQAGPLKNEGFCCSVPAYAYDVFFFANVPSDGFTHCRFLDWIRDVSPEDVVYIANVDYEAFSDGLAHQQCLDGMLLEEKLVSDSFVHVEVLSAFAEAHDPVEKRVVAVLELFHETEPAQLNAKLDYAVNSQYLVVAVFHLSRVGFHLFPIFNNIYQTGFTLTVMQAQFKNNLSLQRDYLFGGYRKEMYLFSYICRGLPVNTLIFLFCPLNLTLATGM